MSHAYCVFYTAVIPDMPGDLRGMIGNPESPAEFGQAAAMAGFPFSWE